MQLKTRSGYDFFECSSALQKAIRLGDEENAHYFAVELFNSGYDGYLWKRLKIICSEDIGLASGQCLTTIATLFDFYERQKAEKHPKKPERMFLVHAVTYLVRCPKSRLIDWQVIALWREEHSMASHPVPEYAFDMHNLKGKQRGHGVDHFFDEGCKLENHKSQNYEIEAREKARKLIKAVPKPILYLTGKEVKQTDMFTDPE